MTAKEKIIIDTDIGDDIDDAFAIVLATLSDEIELLGITTVFRNSSLRAKMAKALLDSYGVRNIPVYAGCDIPLLATESIDSFTPCQYDEKSMSSFDYEQGWGPDFIIESVLKYPGEITLVPIGPLTNIAMAVRKRPEIISKIKRIVLMGGFITEDVPEWNILCDPEAARVVYTCGAPVYAVGLDVTMKCKLVQSDVEEFRSIGSRGSIVLSHMLDDWYNHYKFECPVLHDPLTVGTLIDESFVEFEKSEVKVLLTGNDRGKTVRLKSSEEGSSTINIAIDTDSRRYLSLFKQRLFI